ncbi:MAG: hypothetical protein ACHQFZ_01025 [Acidimicrobiales bacterium]
MTSTPPPYLVERIGWSLVWLAVVSTGVDAWGDWSTWPGLAVVTPLLVLVGLVGLVLVWTTENPASRAWQHVGLGAAVGAVLFSGGAEIGARLYYTTDSAAFNDVATSLLVHGHNPYTSSLAGTTALLHPASGYWTYLLDGGHVSQVSYPAGAFLLQAPLVLLGLHHLTTDWLDLAAWVATVLVLFRALPSAQRWLAPLLLLATGYALSFANGGTDALFLPFLALAVWRWDRFVTPAGSRLYPWLSPVALGVACSIKQSPWFAVPFLLVAVALEARHADAGWLRCIARYAAWLVGTFTVINLPFLVWNANAWWHGTMLPLLSPLVPDGQGLITVALHGASRGVNLDRLWIAAALVTLALLAALALWYPRLKRAWLLFVPLVLFVPGRSLSSYLLDFFPVAVIAAVSVARPAERAPLGSPRVRRAAIAVPLAAAVGFAWWSLASAPLDVRVVHVATLSHHTAYASVTLRVRNDATGPVTPHFMLTVGGGHPTGYWDATVTSGRFPLAAGASATVVIRPPTFTWAPQYHTYWLISAYTSSPAGVSTSGPILWRYGQD